LKTLKKINRKTIRNSLEIEKAISAQVGPLSPALARAPCALQAGPACRRKPERALSLSLSRCPVGQTCRRWFPHVRPLSLSLPRRLHWSAVLNLPPTISPPWTRPRSPRRGRAHDRTFSGHVRAPAPLLSPAPYSPTPPLSFAPSAQLSRPLSLCPREQGAPPPPADDHCLFRGRRCTHVSSSVTVSFAFLSAARDTLRCTLYFPAASGPRSLERFLRSRSPAAVDPRLHRTPSFSKRPGVRTRGEHPSHAVISPSIIPAPAQLHAGVSCAAAEPFLPRSAFSSAPVSVLHPRSCSSCRAERVSPFP
jgi:hypothetical protein